MKENNQNINQEENIILNSLGLLEKKEKEFFKKEIINYSAEDKKAVSDFNNLTSLFFKLVNDKSKEITPSPSVKDKLFAKINGRQKDFHFIFAASDNWEQHPIDGIQFKKLSYNEEKNYLMLLFKVAADTSYPEHHHSGAEECYVISGDVYTEGRVLGPGDFLHAEGGSDHEMLYTKNGCTLLLVVEPKDYM